jgi:hypothetical protein
VPEISQALGLKILGWAAARVNGPGAWLGPTEDDKRCWTLVERALHHAHAKTSRDFDDGTPFEDQDYQWGEPILDLTKVRPGDILQFRDYYATEHDPSGAGLSFRFPHHSAIVKMNFHNGDVTIVEQGPDHAPRFLKIPIYGNKHISHGKSMTDTVTGQVWAYRPVPKISHHKSKH